MLNHQLFKASQKTGQRFKVSSDRLVETRIERGTPGYTRKSVHGTRMPPPIERKND